MQIRYENKKLEQVTIAINVLAAAMVTASFVLLFGFIPHLLVGITHLQASAQRIISANRQFDLL